MLVVFVTPFFTENSRLFVASLARMPEVRLALVAQESADVLPAEVRARVVAAEVVANAMRGDDVASAAQRIQSVHGRIHRILGPMEQVQEAAAEARERLGVEGVHLATALNFRDKRRMKDVLRAAGLPVARHRLAATLDEALAFAREVGFPVVVKPPAGAASQDTFRVMDADGMRAAFAAAARVAEGKALLEEFVTGAEHSYDAFIRDGRVLWYSTSNYLPACLDAMQNPWIQWCIMLPREHGEPDFAPVGEKMLNVLGLRTGVCHAEWFRRKDGSVVVSEVGARPGGAMLPTLMSRAHDVDWVGTWARFMTTGGFAPFPERKYATGAAFLRGQGHGRVRAVHGLEQVFRDVGHLVTDTRLPRPGQEKSRSYEGEGVICVRHPETAVVRDVLRHVISTVRVEIG